MADRYTRPRVGADAPRGRIRWGPLPLDTFGSLISRPTSCEVWEKGKGDRRITGIFHRGSGLGAQVDLNDYWCDPEHIAEDGSRVRNIRSSMEPTEIILGQTLDGTPFTLDNCFVADGLTSSRLHPGLSFFGAHFDAPPMTDCVEICFEGIHHLFGQAQPVRTYANDKLRALALVGVGKALVKPVFDVEETSYHMRSGRYGFRIQESRRHPTSWWLSKWLNPLQMIVSLCSRQRLRPSLMTLLFDDEKTTRPQIPRVRLWEQLADS